MTTTLLERKEVPTKRLGLIMFVMLVLLGMAPLAMAMPDPFATLLVWPINTPEGAEGPIIVGPTSQVDLIIYNKDDSHVLDDVWLLLVIDSLAYDHLVSISTNTSLSFLPTNFEEIPAAASPSDRIPPTGSDPGTTPTHPYAYRPNGWPGIEYSDQYDVGSLRSKLDIADGESMWYSAGDLDDSTGWIDHGPPGLNKQDPEYFAITVELDSEPEEGNGKVLILALGHTDDWPGNRILNVHSPYTRSTLMLSELRAILLVLAPISAFGLYKVRHKIRKKQTQEF